MERPRGTERRQSERTPFWAKTLYRIRGGETRFGESRNISDGGLLLTVAGDIKMDDVLEVELPMSSGFEPLKTRARVVHLREIKKGRKSETLAGIKFLHLSALDQQAIGRKIWNQILRESTRLSIDQSPDK